jgi:hypothetical protein
MGILSQLVEGTITEQQLFSPGEMFVIQALLENAPDYCPYEVVLAAITGKSVERCRARLGEADEEGAIDALMRPVRNLLARCRLKLRPFGIQVRSMVHTGYLLVPLKSGIRERVRMGE